MVQHLQTAPHVSYSYKHIKYYSGLNSMLNKYTYYDTEQNSNEKKNVF